MEHTDVVATFSSIDVVHTNNTIVGACGTQIDFFSETQQRTPGYTARYANNKSFTPRKIMLHDQSTKILTLTPDKKHVMCRIDTETGKNVGQIAVKLFHDDVNGNLDTVVPFKKFSHLQDQPDLKLVGIAGNSLIKLHWDTRVPVVREYTVAQETSFTRPQKGFRFTAVATTKQGHIAAGSKDGTIRLFTNGSTMKKTKTEISQLGDPIKGIDVSSDGEWIVWTTDSYLAVLCVTWTDSMGTHSGFETSMPNEVKRVLVLGVPEIDLQHYGIEEVFLTPARFDNGPYQGTDGVIEEEIITSSGPFVIRFKFRLVKADFNSESRVQQRARPIIYKQEQDVTDKTFVYGTNSVVAALANDVRKIDLGENSEFGVDCGNNE